jgi:membrane protein implicated in regulation of membrane protease activity
MFDNGAWFWIWAILAAFFYVGEIFTAAFFMMPFGVGATVAAILAYFDVDVGWQWAAFIVVSGISVVLLRRYSQRFTHEPPERMGADRLVGETGVVVEELIPHSTVGQVLVQREQWRADAPGHGNVPIDTKVIVEAIDGTHLIVEPIQGAVELIAEHETGQQAPGETGAEPAIGPASGEDT